MQTNPFLSLSVPLPVCLVCAALLLFTQHLVLMANPSLVGCNSGTSNGPNSLNVNAGVGNSSKNSDGNDKPMSIEISTYGVRGPLSWECVNEDLRDEFTMQGKISMKLDQYNGDRKLENGLVTRKNYLINAVADWTDELVKGLMEKVKNKNPGLPASDYGAAADTSLHSAFEKYPLNGLNVIVVGSVSPWMEAFCLTYGAKSVTSAVFTMPKMQNLQLIRAISVHDLLKINEKFDVVISYSSLEHEGLGRYGDPINPNGDIERLKTFKTLLKEEGKLFLAVPSGPDCLTWNAHRIYGPGRLLLLTQGWKLLDTFYADPNRIVRFGEFDDQPVRVFMAE